MPSARLAVLFEISPVSAATGVRQTMRFCSGNDDRLTGLNDEKWWPGIAKSPTLNREGWNGNFDGSISLASAAVEIHLAALKKNLPTAAAMRWAGAPLSIYRGVVGDPWASFERIFDGLVTSYETDSLKLSLTAQVDSEPFETPILTKKYAGTGGYEGVEDLKEKVRPAVFGRALNVEPVRINEVDNIYEVHAYGPVEGIVAVYEKAASFGASLGDYPDFSSLLHATIPEGHWASCNALGLFRLGAPPAGVITADVDGDNTGGWSRSTAEVMLRLCDIADVDIARIDTASMAAFETACPYPINLYLTSADKLIDVIQRIARPCNAQAALSWLGKLQVTTFNAVGTPTMTLDAQGKQLPAVLTNAETDVSPPWWRIEMRANRSWRVHSKDEIAYFDPAENVAVPAAIYRRWPYLPPTPAGDGIPEGWSKDPPGFSGPSDTPSSIHRAFGPVWACYATQQGGAMVGEWSEPTLADSRFKGFVLWTNDVGDGVVDGTNKILATSDAVKGSDDLPVDLDFTVPDGTYTGAFSYEGITGPFKLTARVRHAGDRVAIGVTPISPYDSFGLGDPLSGEIKDGFYVAQNDTVEASDTGPTPISGVYVYQDFDAGSVLLTEDSDSTVLRAPIDDCLFEMVWNGQSVEHWVNSVRVRTTFINGAWDGMTHWPVFVPMSPNAEIYDITWERATQGSDLEFPYAEVTGHIRRMESADGWETYLPDATGAGGAGGYFKSRTVHSGGYGEAVPVGTTDEEAYFNFPGVGGFIFDIDGPMTYRAITLAGLVGTTQASGSRADGDSFAIEWDKKQVKLFKAGGLLKKKKKTNPSSYLYGELPPTHGFGFQDIKLNPRNENEFVVRGTTADASILSPISDTSPTDGGYIIVAETADMVYLNVDQDDFTVTASLTYAFVSGAAGNFNPQTRIEISTNGGSSWSTLTSTTVPASPTVSTGSPATLTLSANQTKNGSGAVRYRLAVKNATAGAYSATLTGNLSAVWTG